MNTQELARFGHSLQELYESYDCYRVLQEQEHALLSRRAQINEWNQVVRKKNIALTAAKNMEDSMAVMFKNWTALGGSRLGAPYVEVRSQLAKLQSLLMRILNCDRMNESLLYNQGYIQSISAYRGAVASVVTDLK